MVLPCFSAVYHKRRDFRGKNVLQIKYTFRFSLQLLPEMFLVLRRIQRDVIVNIHKSSDKIPVINVRV
jgi:hypothetical protein